MRSLVDDAKNNPLSNATIVLLLFLIMASFPITALIRLFYSDFNNLYFAVYSIRIIFSGLFLFLLYKFGLIEYFKIRLNKGGWLVFIAVMLIAINNFPFVSLITNDVSIASAGFEWQYLLAMLSVAFTEEIVFRGFLIAFISKSLLEKPIKRRAFLVILISSAIFALTHLINLFSGANFGATILQVSYTFLIGVILALLAIKTRTIVLPIIAHFVYNIGGNLPQYGLLNGMPWTVGQIVITVVVSLIVAVFIIWQLYKLNDEELLDFLPEAYKN